jgi:hypothetical protein
VRAETIWQLAPNPSKPSARKLGSTFDISGGEAGEKSVFKLSRDENFKVEGVNVTFEVKDAEEGARGPDSPSDIYLKDEGSSVDILVDGQKVEKGKAYKLDAGTSIQFGEEGYFQIQRDARAHA